MRIGIISDLHIDANNRALKTGENFVDLLADLLRKEQVDLLLHAGDVASDYRISQKFNEDLEEAAGLPILFVPGNHDLWSRKNKEENTLKIWNSFKEAENSLIGRPRILNDKWAVVGNMGWYDYSFADQEKYSPEEFEAGKYRFGFWNDKKYIHFPWSDQELTQLTYNQLKEDIEAVQDKNIIMMTHVASHPGFVVPLPHKLYDFFNAYMGSRLYAELYQDYPVKYNIMGHVHFRHTLEEDGVTHIMACLGNRKHWRNREDVADELSRTLKIIEIED